MARHALESTTVSAAAVTGSLGDPSRVVVRRVVRVSYQIEWEYDGWKSYFDETGITMEPVRRVKRWHLQGRRNACRAAALRLIFTRRERYATAKNEKGYPTECRLCDSRAEQQCRYHGGRQFDRLLLRLTNYLIWRDRP